MILILVKTIIYRYDYINNRKIIGSNTKKKSYIRLIDVSFRLLFCMNHSAYINSISSICLNTCSAYHTYQYHLFDIEDSMNSPIIISF